MENISLMSLNEMLSKFHQTNHHFRAKRSSNISYKWWLIDWFSEPFAWYFTIQFSCAVIERHIQHHNHQSETSISTAIKLIKKASMRLDSSSEVWLVLDDYDPLVKMKKQMKIKYTFFFVIIPLTADFSSYLINV